MNPALWLERAAQLYPTAPALLRGRQLITDYAGFAARAAALGAFFRHAHKIEPGDRIALFLPNCTEYLELLYAGWFAGAVMVPVNAKLHVREAAWMIDNAEAGLVIGAGAALGELATHVKTARPGLIDIADQAFPDLYRTSPLDAPVWRAPSDLAWLFYTSGTTGNPKGVMITCGNIQAMTLSYFADVDTVEHGDATIYAAPMSHGSGLYNFMFVIRGARHVVPESGGFDPDELAKLAPGLGDACLFAAPTMVRRMVQSAKATGYRGDGLKTIVYGGGPMYLADIIEAVDILGPRFAQIYGQGESPMTITALPKAMVAERTHPNWRARLASVGTAHSCVEIKVADTRGRELPRGEIGEILVSGSPVMAGYWQNEKATRSSLRDGWLWTGDVGAMDDDGFLTLHDRSKDVIISGGSNIYPREVEEVLLTHPAIAEVSVIGRPDPEWGEIVIAFVVAEQGAELDETALDELCLTQIARFKRPRHYVAVNALPKNNYGKVLKTELRAMDQTPQS